MGTKKTQSIWDDITKMILSFLKHHWWKLAFLLFVSGIVAVLVMVPITYKNKKSGADFEKGGIEIWQKK